jgi:hypothetical protein
MDKYFKIFFPEASRDVSYIEYHHPEITAERIVCTEETYFIFHRIAKILTTMRTSVHEEWDDAGRTIIIEDEK